MICLRPAAVFTATGPLTPADPTFDPFWARVNEAGITVVAHAGDSGYTSNGYAQGRVLGRVRRAARNGRRSRSSRWSARSTTSSRRSCSTSCSQRFPGVRIASVENGSEFLADLFHKLRSWDRKIPGFFPEDPVETFRRNIWINPFWEDDVYEIAELMGADRVIFGSDWPHIEGMPEPLDYVRS